MKLSEVFDQLKYGELSQISIGGAQPGVIDDTNYESILAHVNLAMLALYKRFPLKEGHVTVQLQAGKIAYPITSNFAASNRRSQESFKYVLDTMEFPFLDDIFKIENVQTDQGLDMALNDQQDEFSVYTPSVNLLQVPWDIAAKLDELPNEWKTSTVTVSYQAMPVPIVKGMGNFDPTRVEVELPYSHLEPLLLYVASRVNNPIGIINGNTNFTMGNNYAAKYEAACQALETVNLRVDQGSQNHRLEKNGWV